MAMLALTGENFSETIDQNEFVFIDFWAEWCGPCKVFAKVIEEIAPKHPDFIFASINVDEEKQLAEDFHIQSVPSVMVMRNRVVLYADSGTLSPSALADLLDQAKSLDPGELE